MSDSASPDADGLARTLVLNGLAELCGGQPVLVDDESRDLLERAFDAALHPAERDRFGQKIAESDVDDLDDESQRFLATCAGDVLDELVERGTHATLLHDARLSVPAREAAVYSFLTTQDPATLDRLAVGDDVRDHLRAGATAVTEGAFDRAVDAFDEGVTASAGGDGVVACRVLAGYACHRAGRDADAIDYVEETLHLETNAWTAKLVGQAADHRYSEKFRSGKLGSRLFFRWSTGIPDEADVVVSAGPANDGVPGERVSETTPLSGRDECHPFERLWPETTVRVSVSGDLPSIPGVDSYYVAAGVADLEVFEARSIESVFLSGPAGIDAVERIRFE